MALKWKHKEIPQGNTVYQRRGETRSTRHCMVANAGDSALEVVPRGIIDKGRKNKNNRNLRLFVALVIREDVVVAQEEAPPTRSCLLPSSPAKAQLSVPGRQTAS